MQFQFEKEKIGLAVGDVQKWVRFEIIERKSGNTQQVSKEEFSKKFPAFQDKMEFPSSERPFTTQASDGTRISEKCKVVELTGFTECEDGKLLLGNPPRTIQVQGVEEFNGMGAVCAAETVHPDALWVGTCHHYTEEADIGYLGLLIVSRKNGRLVKKIDDKAGLLSNLVKTVRLDKFGETVWIATPLGVQEFSKSGQIQRSWKALSPALIKNEMSGFKLR